MSRTDQSRGAAWGLADQLRAAQAEAATLRRQVAELEADMEGVIAGLCYAAVHDGRSGRVGLPILWKSCLGYYAQP